MISGALKRSTFLFYLAACNFIVFNFGFHVHEKAILMTVIPLALDVHQGSSTWVKLRFVILKTVALWTLLPLLISQGESLAKHLILALDYFLTARVWLRLKLENPFQKLFLYSLLAVIAVIETWQVLFIEIIKGHAVGWMYIYQCLVPIVATLVNQVIFLEMMYKAIISPPQSKLGSISPADK